MTKINEKELKEIFIELKKSNKKAFEELYSKYKTIVYSIAFSILKNKAEAEDIMQTVFEKIYSMEKEKLPTKNEASWIYALARNETISTIRKRKNNVSLENIYEIENNTSEIESIIDKETYNKLINGLNEKEKEIISLKILAKLSFAEISKLLNEPVGTVKWRYYKTVNTLKILITNLGMFVITFIIGIKVLLNKKQIKNSEKIPNTNNYQTEGKKENSISEEQKGEIKNNIETNEIVGVVNKESNYNNFGIGILGISGIFLIITLIFSIFLIKHQPKTKPKTSK